jgi:RHS repeat-associated protein
VSFEKRSLSQSFAYDWLGNTTATGDDASGFYDRSLGEITNAAASGKPYQLSAASNEAGGSPRAGHLSTTYDDAGNLRSMAVVRAGPCVPAGSVCGQRYAYDWDEVGQLTKARRWDVADPGSATDALPEEVPAVELRYAYDGGGQRVLKTAVDPAGAQVHTVYALGSVELRRAPFQEGDYVDDHTTEVGYLSAHGVKLARLHYAEGDLPSLSSGHLHVLLEMPDHLGSSSIVIDRETSELVERSTYLAPGTADSDYRTERWDSFREDYRFTGKEEDSEVGLAYFGARYLAPSLGRWISADPLAVHGLGADMNVYAYVSGKLLSATDPLGLDNAPIETSTVQVEAKPGPVDTSKADPLVGSEWDAAKRDYFEWGMKAQAADEADSAAQKALLGPGLAPLASLTPGTGVRLIPRPARPDVLANPIDQKNLDGYADAGRRFFVAIKVALTVGTSVALGGGGGVAATENGAGTASLAADAKAEIETAKQERVLVDSNAIAGLKKDPTLGGRIQPGEQPVASYVSGPELNNAHLKSINEGKKPFGCRSSPAA